MQEGNFLSSSGEQALLLNRYLAVRFSRVTFTAQFLDDTELVRDKASALRGGMGEMLLNANCVINGRKCDSCGFASECLIQKMLYSRLESSPAFMQSGDSVGYMVYCGNRERTFCAGDTMEFTLTLFGGNIIYFTQYLNAFYALGQNGLGANRSRFRLIEVKNLFGQRIMDGSNIYMDRYKWQTLREYVDHRFERLKKTADGRRYLLRFCSMTNIKYHGQFLEAFTGEALKASLLRRLYILNCFENLQTDAPYQPLTEFPAIQAAQTRYRETYRRSNRKGQTMKLRGLEGDVWIERPTDEWLRLLLSAEITGIGKETSFGLGKIRVIQTAEDEKAGGSFGGAV